MSTYGKKCGNVTALFGTPGKNRGRLRYIARLLLTSSFLLE